jgi:hypothetical protein
MSMGEVPTMIYYRFTVVDLRNVSHKDEPWVLAATVTQVFYILPKTRRNTSLFLENNELSELTMWRMRKNTTNVTRCLFYGYKKDKYD